MSDNVNNCHNYVCHLRLNDILLLNKVNNT